MHHIHLGSARLVAFDFDGTLVDTMQRFADTAAGVMAERFGVNAAWARRRYLETSGVPFFQQLERIFPGDARNESAAGAFEQGKLDAFFQESFDADVLSTLAWLRSQGYLVAVSSNNFQELLDQFVAREPVEFDIVLGCRENFFKGRDHFELIEHELGVAPRDVLFVGDSLMDGVRAAECGVPFVGRTGTFTAEAFHEAHPGAPTIDRLGDLIGLLRQAA